MKHLPPLISMPLAPKSGDDDGIADNQTESHQDQG
jgi:hypothetical protein